MAKVTSTSKANATTKTEKAAKKSQKSTVKVEIIERAERVSKRASAKAEKEKELGFDLASLKDVKMSNAYGRVKASGITRYPVGRSVYFKKAELEALAKEYEGREPGASGISKEEAEKAYKEHMKSKTVIPLISRGEIIEQGLTSTDYYHMERKKQLTKIKIAGNVFYTLEQFTKHREDAFAFKAKREAKAAKSEKVDKEIATEIAEEVAAG